MDYEALVEAVLLDQDFKTFCPMFEMSGLECGTTACPLWPGRTRELVSRAVAVALTGRLVVLMAADKTTAERVMKLAREIAGGSLSEWLRVKER